MQEKSIHENQEEKCQENQGGGREIFGISAENSQKIRLGRKSFGEKIQSHPPRRGTSNARIIAALIHVYPSRLRDSRFTRASKAPHTHNKASANSHTNA